jgi:oligopeptide/dipeptide ABC transporter ATP-binding protein
VTDLVKIDGLRKYFPVKTSAFGRARKFLRAVDGVTFNIEDGETLALVGESGCGKTTTGKLVLRLIEPTAGTIRFMGLDVCKADAKALMKMRRQMQMVFQDPYASLNPRKTIGQIVRKSFAYQKVAPEQEIATKVEELLEVVGLSPASLYINRHPHEFSGGQRQRIGIARAIALKPKLVVADEPVSALDMSVRAQVLNLMKQLKKDFGLTYLFITHDLAVVRSMCDRVAVMYLGKIVELAAVTDLYENPLHPYTSAMLSATPIPNPRLARSLERTVLTGDVSSPIDPPSGCRFHPRCPIAIERCSTEEPQLLEVRPRHWVACHLAGSS